MHSSVSRSLRAVGVLAIVVAVAAAAVYAVPALVGAEHSYVVLTGSMEPSIGAGDVVILDERPTDTIAEGDVITFAPGGYGSKSDVRVTHRVVEVHERTDGLYFETKGDANEDPDPGLVRADRVVGVVMFHIPWFGYVVSFAGTPLGKFSLIIVPAGLLAVTELHALVRGDRNERRENEGGDA
ncbi:peptidase S26B, signal peptidase [Haloferax mucosum ATCC BAA-1512]|uniref:Peptidase S26B, signal peptidase n=1 Tax=Haloferax mucosum ATCC BAA-1512 TaxID=662479 RepID=M0IT06_9EURY|nr:signal peptidase I [Haloferax mucosum]ELZ98933.1 peptidase S26B, signal peptidase [Haloferax mucosum ATCC BAA-1512]